MKELIAEYLAESAPYLSTKVRTALAQGIESEITKTDAYVYRLVTKLVAAGMFISVECDGEMVDEGHELSSDPDEIYEDIQAVDECYLQVYDKNEVWAGWIYIVNCNDGDESVCDYTCGDVSEQMVFIIEGDV